MASLSLSKLPWKAQLAVFVALAAGSARRVLLLPRHAGAGAPRDADGRARRRCARGSTRVWRPRGSCPSSARKSQTSQSRLDGLRPILPEEKDAADLLRRVHTLAVQSNLTIRGFKPQAITTRELHAEWPISLELEGTYHNLGMFLDRVSKFPRIINVSGLSIRGKTERAERRQRSRVTCTATTFVLLDPPAADAAPADQRKAAKKATKKTA